MRKFFALLMALVLLVALAAPTFAAEDDTAEANHNVTITIVPSEGGVDTGETYTAFKIFDATIKEGTDLSGEPGGPGATEGVSYTIKKYMDERGRENRYYVYVASYQNAKGEKVFDLTSLGNDEYLVTRREGVELEEEHWIEYLSSRAVGSQVFRQTIKDGTATLEPGYYLIKSSLGTAVMVDTVGKDNITIKEKNLFPTLELGILKDSPVFGTTEGDKIDTKIITDNDYFEKCTNTYAYPSVWKLGVSIPATANKEIVITLDPEWITIFSIAVVPEEGITISEDKMTITLSADYVKAHEVFFATISGYLQATTQEEDPVDQGSLDAYLTYSNYTSARAETEVRTFDVDVVKTDKDGKLLNGAKFQLLSPKYNEEAPQNIMKLSKRADGVYYVDPMNGTTDPFEAGKVQIQGLGSVEFELKEVEAPAGYNPLDSNVKYTPTADNFATLKAGETDQYDNGLQVANYTGAELPSTGGIGTTIFYIVGGLLVAGAAVLLVTKKRAQG